MTQSDFGTKLVGRPFAAILGTVLLLRVPASFQSVIDWDESIYIVVARELLNGALPYSAVFDHKPIGLYYLFAGFIGVLGDDPFSVRLLGMLVVAGAAILLRQILIEFGGLRDRTALWLALSYVVATGGLGGAAVNTEIIVNVLTLTWIYLVLIAVRNGSVWPLFIAGCAMGLSFQVNYLSALLIVGFSIGYLCFRLKRDDQMAKAAQAFVVDGLVIFGGFVVANALLLGPLILFGNFSDYVSYQQAYLFNYKPTVSTTDSLEKFFETGQAFLPLVALIWFGWVLASRKQNEKHTMSGVSFGELAVLFLPILVAAFAALSASFRFYQHYFLFLLPPAFLLCGVVFARFSPRTSFYRFGVVLLVVASFNIGIRGFIEAGKGAVVAAQMAFSERIPADRSRNLARTIRPLLGDGDTIYVACDQTILYQLAHVSPPTQFAHFPHALMPSYAKAFGVEISDTIDRILDKRPAVIVFGNVNRCRKVPEAVWQLLEDKIRLAGYEYFQDYRGGRLFVRPRGKPIQFSESAIKR